MDRRGRGESGDRQVYSIEREYEDIAAVANAIDDPLAVLGHSFGAVCVLGAVRFMPNLRRLILYEPPMLRAQHNPERAELLEKMDQALEAGKREEVVVLLLRDLMHTPPAAIERMRSTPAWERPVSAAHTIPRELRQSDAHGSDLEFLKSITVPTLFLLGSDSADHFRVTTETLNAIMPNSRIVILQGQQHSAMFTAPELLAKEIIQFLST
jgi:pimeloyl-ACP methyl ester carboxylesterase